MLEISFKITLEEFSHSSLSDCFLLLLFVVIFCFVVVFVVVFFFFFFCGGAGRVWVLRIAHEPDNLYFQRFICQ